MVSLLSLFLLIQSQQLHCNTVSDSGSLSDSANSDLNLKISIESNQTHSPTSWFFTFFSSYCLALFTFIVFLAFSTAFRFLRISKSQQIQDTPISSSVSAKPDLVSLSESPSTCASSTESINLSDISGLSLLEDLIDNGNLNRYFQIQSEAPGKKGMLARHLLDGQVYLIKVKEFQIDCEKIEEEILFEVSRYRNLKCANVSRYVTCWIEETLGKMKLFIQMEIATGQELEDYIEKGVKLDEAVKILRKVAKVLLFVHKNRIVHGNLSVRSIFVDEFGKVAIDGFEFYGDRRSDLMMFNEVCDEVIGKVDKDQVEKARKLVSLDRFVKRLGIYSEN